MQQWEETNQRDLERELAAADHGRAGTHRKRASTFIVPQEWLLGRGTVIWDKRQYEERKAAGLPPLENGITMQSSAEKPRMRLLAKQLRHMAQQAGIRDEHKLTQLTESGIFSYSK
eukprot:SAG11_NODE_10413_length_833_cov_2.907357_1_plen_115_part_10